MFLAIAYDRNRDPTSADAAFQRAITLAANPRLVLVYNYGIFLARNGRYAEARPLLQRAAELAPQRADIAAALERTIRSLQGPPR